MKKIKIAKQKAHSSNNPETGQFEKYEKGLTRFETLYVNSSEDLQRSFIEVL